VSRHSLDAPPARWRDVLLARAQMWRVLQRRKIDGLAGTGAHRLHSEARYGVKLGVTRDHRIFGYKHNLPWGRP
jgi:hypothetical protein